MKRKVDGKKKWRDFKCCLSHLFVLIVLIVLGIRKDNLAPLVLVPNFLEVVRIVTCSLCAKR